MQLENRFSIFVVDQSWLVFHKEDYSEDIFVDVMSGNYDRLDYLENDINITEEEKVDWWSLFSASLHII